MPFLYSIVGASTADSHRFRFYDDTALKSSDGAFVYCHSDDGGDPRRTCSKFLRPAKERLVVQQTRNHVNVMFRVTSHACFAKKLCENMFDRRSVVQREFHKGGCLVGRRRQTRTPVSHIFV